MEPPQALNSDDLKIWTDKKLAQIQSRVCNALKAWLENYWIDSYGDCCLDDIHEFASGPMMKSQASAAAKILELVSKKVAYLRFNV